MLQGKWSLWHLDDIVINAASTTIQQLECAVCQCIWQDPVETVCCRNIFCRDCLAQCTTCPLCRKNVSSTKECNNAVLHEFWRLQVRCPFHDDNTGDGRNNEELLVAASMPTPYTDAVLAQVMKRRKKESSTPRCQWEGTHADFLLTHIHACKFAPVECPEKCGMIIPRQHLHTHAIVCSVNVVECEVCHKRVHRKDLPTHNDENTELHFEILMKLLEAHEQRHAAIFENLVDENIATKSVVWKIPDAKDIMQDSRYPKGSPLSSPKVYACGYDFTLEFHPNGNQASFPGCACISVGRLPHSTRFHIKYTINDRLTQHDRKWGEGTFCGWPLRSHILDLLNETNNILEIKVEILDIALFSDAHIVRR